MDSNLGIPQLRACVYLRSNEQLDPTTLGSNLAYCLGFVGLHFKYFKIILYITIEFLT